MNFFTKIDIPAAKWQIDYNSHIAFFGSCFADNISAQFAARKFKVLVNPFGTVYNPLSIAAQIHAIANEKKFGEPEVFQDMRSISEKEWLESLGKPKNSGKHSDAPWHCWDAHSSLSAATREECIAKLDNAVTNAREFLQKADAVFITLGTAFVYFLKGYAVAVSNCHRQNPNLFIRKMIYVEHVVKALECIVQDLRKIKSDMRIVFTVSPLRHLSDGAHENTLSKATLQLAIEKFIREIATTPTESRDDKAGFATESRDDKAGFAAESRDDMAGIAEESTTTVSYFPSYEIVMDELRDYRFYDNDMIHLSKTAEEYIFERMVETYCDKKTRDNIKQVEKFLKSANHRIQDADSPATATFLQKLHAEATRLESQIAGLNLDNEKHKFEK
ncbi:GSCFA domain-containing protein [Fibrobacter sp.]|uniref:GSCFA domain-containing protein n=1 Tax=Fibrobacter sp. TaxID=35828 RepID=UPI0025C2F412|nr:GSCFA domain-containing protein [Fibrobacter sp.]MBR3074078.1 GSCFA domain-containing protein [Fibrobacter sp.]